MTTLETTTPQLDWLVNTSVEPMFEMTMRGNSGDYPRDATGPAASNGKRNYQVDPIICADGTTLSVQASAHMYCSPRTDDAPYTHVEVGFPICDLGREFDEYQDGEGDHTASVFGYVPVELVQTFIAIHGGEKL